MKIATRNDLLVLEWQFSVGNISLSNQHEQVGTKDKNHRGSVWYFTSVHNTPVAAEILSIATVPNTTSVSAFADL